MKLKLKLTKNHNSTICYMYMYKTLLPFTFIFFVPLFIKNHVHLSEWKVSHSQ